MGKETMELFKEGIALVKEGIGGTSKKKNKPNKNIKAPEWGLVAEGIGGTSKKKNKPTLNFWRRFCKHARELNEYAPKISIPVHIEEKEE